MLSNRLLFLASTTSFISEFISLTFNYNTYSTLKKLIQNSNSIKRDF